MNDMENDGRKHESREQRAIRRALLLSLVITAFVFCVRFQVDNLYERKLVSKFSITGRAALYKNRSIFTRVSEDNIKQRTKPIETYPKIALLFINSGPMPHEPLWRAFFETAAKFSLRDPPPALDYLESINSQLLERSNIISNSKERRLFASEDEVSEIVCDGEEEKLNTEIERLMNVTDNASSVISGQSLFSVYVHPGPTYNYTESSIFYRKEVEERVDTKTGWGTFKLVEAELSLIRAALKDKRNKKFVLLSESCIPLHPPEVIYAQIISEKKSRLKACENQLGDNIERYTPDLNGKYFNRSDWRKSNQWFCLNRAHAEFIVNETYLRPRFKEHCNGWHGLRQCISDEHYIASALGIYGFGNQTDCQGASTYVLFNGSLPHPITFGPEEINPRLLIKMRQGTKCNIRDAWSTTVALLDGTPRTNTCLHQNFSSFNSSTKTDQSLDWVEARGYKPLDSSCYLFARKFPGTAVRETLRAALACMGGGLGHWC